MNSFTCLRYRFRFTARDPVRFPPGKIANVVRGAFGIALRDTAPPDVYSRLFEPKAQPGQGPSGLADLPRPFVFRLHPAVAIPAESEWPLTLHLFDRSPGLSRHFQDAFTSWERSGLGPRRGRLRLIAVEQLPAPPIDLDAAGQPTARAEIRFVTPTELKADGEVTARPEFPILFARLRDRIATLSALYGDGPLDVDFAGLGERAAAIELRWLDIAWEKRERTSTRTGQTHPIGGFVALAEYQGALAEFLPWLRAGEYSGVGRQTAWGKGEIKLERCWPDPVRTF